MSEIDSPVAALRWGPARWRKGLFSTGFDRVVWNYSSLVPVPFLFYRLSRRLLKQRYVVGVVYSEVGVYKIIREFHQLRAIHTATGETAAHYTLLQRGMLIRDARVLRIECGQWKGLEISLGGVRTFDAASYCRVRIPASDISATVLLNDLMGNSEYKVSGCRVPPWLLNAISDDEHRTSWFIRTFMPFAGNDELFLLPPAESTGVLFPGDYSSNEFASALEVLLGVGLAVVS